MDAQERWNILRLHVEDQIPLATLAQEKHLVALHHGGKHTSGEIAELFGVARSTVYRIVKRTKIEDSQ